MPCDRKRANYDVARATAESDLTHLAQLCSIPCRSTLDEVLVRRGGRSSRPGQAVPDAAAIAAEEPDPEADDGRERATATAALPAAGRRRRGARRR